MKRKNTNMEIVLRKLTVFCLLLFAFAGSAAAQNDPLVVIKNNINGHDHYLAHDVNNALTAVTDAFDPATCLWYSGNTANVYGLHHNYYFIDGDGNYRFLSAPLQASGTLSLSATLPSIQLLRNTDQIYYFYDWDEGLARGHQYTGVDNNTCTHSWHWYNENDHSQGGECWEVYWIEYNANNEWRLTPESHYSRRPEEDGGHGGVPNAGLFRGVSITEYPIQVTSTDPDHPGLTGLTILHSEMNQGENQQLSSTISGEGFSYNYVPAYTKYVFEGGTHYFYGGEDHENAPTATPGSSGEDDATYEWTISGEGAYYLTFDDGGELVSTSTEETPTVYYSRPNTEGRKIATITLTVTYTNTGATQTLQANILLDVECQSPGISDVSITYEDVTISWYPTADSYRVYLTTIEDNWGSPLYEGDATSYTFTGFAYNTQYYYKVTGICGSEEKPAVQFDFTTSAEPGLLVYGAIFGGGRMANVDGKTEVAIINCDSIHAVYGGNDIAGVVQGADGATITIGVADNDPNDFDDYGTTNADIRICDVYGGGNGYYAYNGTSFEPASYNTVYHIAPDASIVEMTQLHQLGDTVWTNTTGSTEDLVCPTIKKTKITVTNDYVKIDSLFGGAKNAILNATSNDVTVNIEGGTLFAVYGGNNFGGSLGYHSQENIVVNNTKTKTGDDYHNGILGRDFGIGYLFGGGNKVQGQHVYVTVNGGQLDTIFGGGNEADVRSTHVTVACDLGELSNGAFGKVYSDAINSGYSSGDLSSNSINGNYSWNRSGIYNIRTLFGGNNRASMEGVPTLALTSGGIGTVYGGGNEGDMLAQEETTLVIPNSYGNEPDNVTIKYSTHVQTTSPNILIDYLYGGCQKSNVDYSTWAEIGGGHIGTVYGGCNISGDVGSTRVNPSVPYTSPSEEYQAVQGGTYVWASGGTVYKNLFAGSNGFYHCNDGIHYISGVDYCPPESYVGLAIPTHNETHVIVTGSVLVKGNVYAGGNMSPVGFTDATVGDRTFPQFVGLASLRMNGGEVIGNVFGGGNMASILGSNEVMVSGGSIGMTDAFEGSLYGGNDRSGQVGQISNRYFEGYEYASDGHTSLTDVKTYLSLTGTPDINTVYGGGNGFYDYEHGDEVIPAGEYCSYDDQGHFNDKPIQSNTFVDININGFPSDGGGHINTVYGGGDGVTVYGSIKVLLNVRGDGGLPLAYDHVGTIFGGNNRDNVVEHDNAPLVPDIILLQGQVGTVYGGCNKGAMTTGKSFTIGGTTYDNVGSMVRLYSTYTTEDGHSATPTAVVSNAVYGGCRMNDVTYNSLVIMEGGADIPANLFGGCDISGVVQGTSQVVVTGGKALGNIYGGGNGNYIYANNNVYDLNNTLIAEGTSEHPIQAPICAQSGANILGGQVGASGNGNSRSVFGGGYGHETSTTGNVTVNIGNATGSPTIYGDIYGGSAMGSVNTSASDVTLVNVLNGNITGDVYGGGLGYYEHGVDSIAATNNGKTYVNIGADNNGTYTGNVTFGTGTYTSAGLPFTNGRIFGGNNQYGSPLDSVFVNIYKTAHGADAAHNLYPTTTGDWNVAKLTTNAGTQTYAIGAVYGGGNLAAYTPTVAERGSVVHVYACDNTIHSVFGGGNAADVGTGTVLPTFSVTNAANTNVIVEGGRIHRVIGGGNGEVAALPAANIFGTASTTVYAGLIDEVYGGANINGSVDAINLLMSNPNSNSYNGCANYDDEVYGTVFGCANAAPYNKSVTTTIECGVGEIGALYGGSNQNYIGIPGDLSSGVNVTLNLYGGEYDKVFAGSKGIAGTPGTPAHIYGDVTLNLYGGKVTDAFGGSDANGNIYGTITVNVLDYEVNNCGLDVTNIYGASNQTAYEPDNGSTRVSPVVNVIHIKQADGVKGNVFGGGNKATVTSNPKVNIGYLAGMAIPDLYPVTEANRVAKVTGNVFGGGNEAGVTGNDTVIIRRDNSYANNLFGGGNEAGVTGNPVVIVEDGTVNTNVYGGCNTSGTVTGDIKVNLLGGTVTQDVFGGGQGNATQTSGGILVTVDGSTVGRDVYGGSAFGQVNDNTDDLTKVWLKSGTVGGNLYGGGMGQAGTDDWGQLNGKVEVLVNGGTVTGSVFGCNNYNEQPAGTVTVTINETSPGPMNIGGNVYGGGNVAYYDGTPNVLIQNGTVTNKVFGGGNNISTANKGVGGSNVVMSGGTVLGGIFGGCNTDGDVEGVSHVTLINGTIGSTSARASIHGGGYGESTGVLGNVTVDFGQASASHNNGLILYGDLYGGSALGNVNDNSSDITTVNVLNGIIQGIGDDPAITGYYGNVFGGGLGDESHPAAVNGVVHVNIGTETANGLASLVRCNVYGCNNQKGSPQDNVYVDVWGTTHTTTDEVDYYDFDRTYAIYQVFGGGNQADYHIENNDGFLKRTHVTVHNCDNTIRYVYGGGNAADADGVETIILGGRFEEIYGGGNGRVTPANITGGGIGLNVVAGNVNFLFEGSNKEGENVGGRWYKPDASSDCLGGLFVDSYFFGTNEAELYGDLTNMINCADAGDFEYRYVYAGSRWGIVYGDINLMVGGGTIENLFGGCRGYSDYSADVRRFPTKAEITTDQALPEGQRKYSAQLLTYMGYPDDFKTELAGHGGNINLVVTGGTIGNIFGGCDVKGNVEGNISVTVSEIDNACPLFVGNVYGASNQWYYNPEHSDINSPMVKILKGTIGGTHPDLPVNNIYGAPATEYEGNVFGGGNQGDVTSQPRVIIGDGTTGATATPVTVKGNVYGGGNRGDITGSPQVVVVPVRHTLNYSDGSGGSISVTNSQYQNVPDGESIGEGIDVSIIATPDDYAHTFTAWAVSSGDAIIAEPNASSTTLTMGTGNATITASFAAASSSYTLSWSAPTGGTFTVTGFKGTVNNGDNVAPGVTFTLAATPDMTHKFKQWTVTGGASVASTQSATTTFTMGSANATITAEFEDVATHILTFTSTEGGSCTVGNVTSGTSIGEGAVLNIVASASSGYAFSNWTVTGSGSVANPNSPSTTFTMGTADATLTAHFVPTHALTIYAPTNGTIRVTTGLGQEVNTGAAVGEGAKLNLKATPATGYAFDKWTITGMGASVENDVLIRPITTFTMGTTDSSISASFITAHTLTVEEPVNGTVKITGTLGQNMASPANIGEGVEISIQAIPDEGYVFNKWEVVSGNGTIDDKNEASATFTMDTQNTIIRAIFVAQ